MCSGRDKKKTYTRELKISVDISKNIIIPENNIENNNENIIINNIDIEDNIDNIDIEDNKLDLYIYYENEKMPIDGWMQSCFKCDLFTARTLIYREEIDRNYIVYICNSCKKRLTNKKENIEFRRRCNKFIKKHFEEMDY